jgi:hypothetical protein
MTYRILYPSSESRADAFRTGLFLAIRLRMQRYWLWMLTQSDAQADVFRLLSGAWSGGDPDAAFYETDSEARNLTEQITAHEQIRDAAWSHLCHTFNLSAFEEQLLALALIAEIDPAFRQVTRHIQQELTGSTLSYPTSFLASKLFGLQHVGWSGAAPNLIRWQLCHLEANTGEWRIDPYGVAWLLTSQRTDPALAAEWIDPILASAQMCLYPHMLDAMERFTAAIWSSSPHLPLLLTLVAPHGSGKRTLAAQFCAALNLPMLCADAALLSPDYLTRTLRCARLNGGVVYWYNTEVLPPHVLQSYLQTACMSVPLNLVGTSTPVAPIDHAACRTFALPALTDAARSTLWHTHTRESVPLLIHHWTPAEIVRAARVAPAGDEAIRDAVRRVETETGDLIDPLACPYTWDDIVLPPHVQQALSDFEQQARLRWEVYNEWGFASLVPLGKGITAMFAGPSGTGKTMAAQVIARSLGMELYRVDLAGVVNKYIGETEKRLKRLFEHQNPNAVLFFDEADALFGQRTNVKDAHDRFANIEIDYLLQRMEQYDGIAILATNRKGDLDSAFTRRLRFIIDFVQPGPAERLRIWRRALHPTAPDGTELLDDVDFDFLAAKFTMNGASIKAAALGAAFLARAEGNRITTQHIIHATRRELAKYGIVVRDLEVKP